MKLIFGFVALLFVGAVSAQTTAAPQQQHPQQELINSLIFSGESLLRNAGILLNSLRDQSQAHLLQAVEHELIFVEALILELREASKHVTLQNIHKIHILQEELLHRENRISEEFDVIINRVIGKNHTNLTAAELITRGEKLVKDAQEELKKLPNSREARAIENELFQVEFLLREVRFDVNKATRLAIEELARHEQTLTGLIQRAKTVAN